MNLADSRRDPAWRWPCVIYTVRPRKNRTLKQIFGMLRACCGVYDYYMYMYHIFHEL